MSGIRSAGAEAAKSEGKKRRRTAQERRPREGRVAAEKAREGAHPRQPAGAVEARRAGRRPVPDRQPAADRRPGARPGRHLRHVRRRGRAARSTSSSAPTGRPCRTTAATCWSGSRSSTWPARSSGSAASAPGRSSSCSRAATQQDPLFLQVKEATASVLEDHLPKSRYKQPGERVVQGQRMMQAASDIFLGWTKGVDANRYFYWRQLRDMKGSADVEAMSPVGLDVLRAASAAGPWPGPTPDPATRSRSPPTWARTTSSTGRSPTSPSATPTRTSATIRPSSRRSDPDGCKRSRASDGRSMEEDLLAAAKEQGQEPNGRASSSRRWACSGGESPATARTPTTPMGLGPTDNLKPTR